MEYKKVNALFLSLLFIFVSVGSTAYADIIDVGNGAIWDNSTNKYWFKDMSRFVNMTFDEQLSEISLVNTDPIFSSVNRESWRMATVLEVGDLLSGNWWDANDPNLSKVCDLLTPTEVGTSTAVWSGRTFHIQSGSVAPTPFLYYDSTNTSMPYFCEIGGSIDSDFLKSDSLGAWVVADGRNPYPVPEPGTLLFMSTAIFMFAGFRKQSRKLTN